MTGVPFWLLFFLLNLPLYVLAVWRIGWPFAIRTFMAVSLVRSFPVNGSLGRLRPT